MSLLNQFIQETEAAADLPSNVVSIKAARAARIRDLAQQWTENALQIGKELIDAQELFPLESVPATTGGIRQRTGWTEWLSEEVGFSTDHAGTFIRIYKTFGDLGGAPIAGASIRLLDYLTLKTIPEEGRKEVIERLRSGEKITRDKAKEIVQPHRPKPEEARQIARETGKPTQASDGNIYLGATKEQEAQAEARRKTVYDLRRAVETFATMEISAEEFLSFALPHQLWNKAEEYQIHVAYEWLTDLVAAWEARR